MRKIRKYLPLVLLSWSVLFPFSAARWDVLNKILTPETRAVSWFSLAGGIRKEMHLDLKFKKLAVVITDSDEAQPYKRAAQKDLSQEEFDQIAQVLERFELKVDVAKRGPAPGGFSYFEVQYRRKTPKIMAREEEVPKGTTYYVLSDVQAGSLLQALDSVAPKPK